MGDFNTIILSTPSLSSFKVSHITFLVLFQCPGFFFQYLLKFFIYIEIVHIYEELFWSREIQLVQYESQILFVFLKKNMISNSLTFCSVNKIKTHTKIQIDLEDKIMLLWERKGARAWHKTMSDTHLLRSLQATESTHITWDKFYSLFQYLKFSDARHKFILFEIIVWFYLVFLFRGITTLLSSQCLTCV